MYLYMYNYSAIRHTRIPVTLLLIERFQTEVSNQNHHRIAVIGSVGVEVKFGPRPYHARESKRRYTKLSRVIVFLSSMPGSRGPAPSFYGAARLCTMCWLTVHGCGEHPFRTLSIVWSGAYAFFKNSERNQGIPHHPLYHSCPPHKA